jgi:hypothetical protein
MQFSPKSKDELEAMSLIKAGTYQFQVAEAKDDISKSSGNEMIKLTLEVFDKEGKSYRMFDYLLEAVASKLFAFCASTGMEQKYHSGNLSSHDCIGKSGYVEIEIQKGKENPQGGTYPDKNNVKKYIAKPIGSIPIAYQIASKEEFDQDVPF